MSTLSSILGSLSTVQINVFTWLNGKKIGVDDLGNIYYRAKPRRGTKRERRWVIYKNEPEASAVPPQWHGWLHHQTDTVPSANDPFAKPWIKKHKANMTGTSQAYFPPGDARGRGKRDKATGDYEAWIPPQ